MSLVETRENFVKLSGRYDLVVDATDWANNGADLYIKGGMDWLDENFHMGPSRSRYFQTLAIDAWYALIQRSRVIQEVWLSTTAARVRLTHKPIEVVREWYAKPWGDIDSGTPLYYSPAVVRSEQDDSTYITIDSFGGTKTDEAGKSPLQYNSIIISPPASVSYEMEVVGLFYSDLLSDDDDENWWTTNQELVSVWAALRMLEVSHRNRQGASDWEVAIREKLLGLEHDMIEEEIAEFNQIEG
jgi:hypothetical protein